MSFLATANCWNLQFLGIRGDNLPFVLRKKASVCVDNTGDDALVILVSSYADQVSCLEGRRAIGKAPVRGVVKGIRDGRRAGLTDFERRLTMALRSRIL